MASYWLERLREIVTRFVDPQRYDWHPTVDPIPVGRSAMIEVYGDPNPRWRDGKGWIADPKWEQRNCVTVSASRIAGYSRRIFMHKKVAPHFIEAMRRAHAACPEYEFHTIGCFNVRRMRHDTPQKAARENRELLPWSDHYAAIAFDINDRRNKWTPHYIEPWSEGWSAYSDLPRGVVLAFESVGFEWGGRWKGRQDTMHFALRRAR